jgi:hypothetical protein
LQQPAFKLNRFAKRRAFGAKPPEISRMRGVAANFKTTIRFIDLGADAAAYAAIGASGLYGLFIKNFVGWVNSLSLTHNPQ